MKGFVTVGVNLNQKLQLTFPRWIARIIGQKRLSISLELPDTKENRKIAEHKAYQINNDIAYGKFKCRSKSQIKTLYQLGLSTIDDTNLSVLSLALWDKYKKDKALTLKPKSMEALDYYSQILSKIEGAAHYQVKEKLLNVTTPQVARKILIYLSSCYEWAKINGLADINPYKGRFSELPKPEWLTDPKPNPFNQAEKEAIIAAFKGHATYRHYTFIIEFMLLTGCRPSEAVGLRKNSVKKHVILFKESIVLVKGKSTQTEKSKNNKIRSFPVNSDLEQLLDLLNLHDSSNDLVFPSVRGRAINLNYLRKVWKKIVTPIKANTTLYCCRDTFITQQISKGVPPAIIAKWVDSSVTTIEKYYLKAESSGLQPL